MVCEHVVTCAGVYADRMAMKSGGSEEPKIVPIRGEYLLLKNDKRHLVRLRVHLAHITHASIPPSITYVIESIALHGMESIR